MPERKHNLPTMFSRLDDQITGDMLDAIVIEAHSRGILYLPGEYSSENRPSGHRVRLIGDIRRHAESWRNARERVTASAIGRLYGAPMTWLTAWPVLLVCFIASVFGIVQFAWPSVRKVTRHRSRRPVLRASRDLDAIDAANLSRALSRIKERRESSTPGNTGASASTDGSERSGAPLRGLRGLQGLHGLHDAADAGRRVD